MHLPERIVLTAISVFRSNCPYYTTITRPHRELFSHLFLDSLETKPATVDAVGITNSLLMDVAPPGPTQLTEHGVPRQPQRPPPSARLMVVALRPTPPAGRFVVAKTLAPSPNSAPQGGRGLAGFFPRLPHTVAAAHR